MTKNNKSYGSSMRWGRMLAFMLCTTAISSSFATIRQKPEEITKRDIVARASLKTLQNDLRLMRAANQEIGARYVSLEDVQNQVNRCKTWLDKYMESLEESIKESKETIEISTLREWSRTLRLFATMMGSRISCSFGQSYSSLFWEDEKEPGLSKKEVERRKKQNAKATEAEKGRQEVAEKIFQALQKLHRRNMLYYENQYAAKPEEGLGDPSVIIDMCDIESMLWGGRESNENEIDSINCYYDALFMNYLRNSKKDGDIHEFRKQMESMIDLDDAVYFLIKDTNEVRKFMFSRARECLLDDKDVTSDDVNCGLDKILDILWIYNNIDKNIKFFPGKKEDINEIHKKHPEFLQKALIYIAENYQKKNKKGKIIFLLDDDKLNANEAGKVFRILKEIKKQGGNVDDKIYLEVMLRALSCKESGIAIQVLQEIKKTKGRIDNEIAQNVLNCIDETLKKKTLQDVLYVFDLWFELNNEIHDDKSIVGQIRNRQEGVISKCIEIIELEYKNCTSYDDIEKIYTVLEILCARFRTDVKQLSQRVILHYLDTIGISYVGKKTTELQKILELLLRMSKVAEDRRVKQKIIEIRREVEDYCLELLYKIYTTGQKSFYSRDAKKLLTMIEDAPVDDADDKEARRRYLNYRIALVYWTIPWGYKED